MGLRFLEKSRQEQGNENRTLLGYLPVSYDSTTVDDGFPNLNSFQKSSGRATFLQPLHKSVDRALERLLSVAFSEFTAASSDG